MLKSAIDEGGYIDNELPPIPIRGGRGGKTRGATEPSEIRE
jgi:hypothetical protein